MKYRMHTESSAMYLIDEDKMTWKRNRPTSGPWEGETVLGLDKDEGKLHDPLPEPSLNERAIIQIGPTLMDYITTTRVVRLELL